MNHLHCAADPSPAPLDVAHPPGAATGTDPRRWIALVLISLAQLMLITDITMVQVTSPSTAPWVHINRHPR